MKIIELYFRESTMIPGLNLRRHVKLGDGVTIDREQFGFVVRTNGQNKIAIIPPGALLCAHAEVEDEAPKKVKPAA